MKLLIKYQIFFALLLATGTVVCFMFLIVNWSIKQGFLQYALTVEEQRLERLAGELGKVFTVEGSWEFLHGNVGRWAQLLVKTLPPERVTPDRQARIARLLEGGSIPLQKVVSSVRRSNLFELRVILLDEGHHPVAGPNRSRRAVVTREIVSRDAVVGYLGLLPKNSLTDTLALRFVRQQTLALTLISVVMLVISAGISYLLAAHLVKPIRTMATAVHTLASGGLDTRVTVSSSDELGQLARGINTLAYTLERNEQLRRQWVADISHELRTPLAVLRGEIEAIQDGVRQPPPEAIGSLHVEATRLNRLVEELYQLSLADSGVLTCQNQELELATVLSGAVTLFRPRFSSRELAIELALPGGEISLYADPERLHQLFTNLLDNSLKYTDPGGRLEVEVTVREGMVALAFQDTVPGVPEAELPRLLERL